MRIQKIRLQNFRAHSDTTVEWSDGVNLVVGLNGAGKTNILEAIHVLCLSRSFLAPNDRYVLQKGAPHYEVEGTFLPDDAAVENADTARDEKVGGRRAVRVRVAYVPGQGKKVFVNGAPLDRVSDLVGRVPVVVFSPDDHRITSEGPDERRKMLDTIMCQWSSTYMDALIQYRRVLKQRNELLQSARRRRQRPDPALMESWDAEFVKHAAAVTGARLRFVEDFSGFLQAAYERVAEVTERPTMTYEPFPGLSSPVPEETVREAFRDALDRTAQTERDRGVTQVGPHRDELLMKIGDLPVRRYASQGQHRTFGMALKLAQYDFLRDRREERPVLLLDDVFDNLDPERITAFLAVLKSSAVGQSITTAARREIVLPYLSGGAEAVDCRVIRIKEGAFDGAESVTADRPASEDVAINP